MDTIDFIQLAVLLILLLLSGFFSRAETAYTGVNRVKIRALAEEHDPKAETVLKILEHYSDLLSSILIGNNIVNLSASALTTTLTIKLYGSAAVGISTGVITLLVLMFGEVIPKRQAAAEPERFSLRYAEFIYAYLNLLKPLIWLVEILARGIAFLFHLNVDHAESVITEEELKTYVEVSHEDGVIESDEMELIHNVFDFGDATAKDIMIPRVEMETIEAGAGFEELKEKFRSTMFTRIPVYKDSENPDNMLGFVNIKDILLVDDPGDFDICRIIRQAHYTTETKKVTDLMGELKDNLLSVAFVINEYGETVGMITMEDLLEELVGEIRDEYDTDEREQIRKVRERQYMVDASVRLDDINDYLGTSFDSENYNSLAGIILEKLERIPEVGDTISLEDGSILKVHSMEDHRVIKILLTLPEEEKTETEE